jgi:hypothetical protein
MNDDGAKTFVVAIVKQACEDYIKSARRIQKNEDVLKAIPRIMKRSGVKTSAQAEAIRQQELLDAQIQIDNIERFLRSDWFNSVSEIKPEALIAQLKVMAKSKKFVSMKITQMSE